MTCTIISTGEELDIVCKNENEPPYPGIKEKLRDKIWELFCRGYDRFLINCEYGVPLWCGEIILALRMYNKIELHIAMPYEEQSTNWAEEQRERFFCIHAQSDSAEIISDKYDDECYERSDQYMINNSDMLLIVGKCYKETYGYELAKSKGIKIESISE